MKPRWTLPLPRTEDRSTAGSKLAEREPSPAGADGERAWSRDAAARVLRTDSGRYMDLRPRGCAASKHNDCPSKAQGALPRAKGERDCFNSPTLRRAWPRDGPEAAICVQVVDVQCVLQFTLIHAAGCALHRRTSRVIHRSKLFSFFWLRPTGKPADQISTNFSLRRRRNVPRAEAGGGRWATAAYGQMQRLFKPRGTARRSSRPPPPSKRASGRGEATRRYPTHPQKSGAVAGRHRRPPREREGDRTERPATL